MGIVYQIHIKKMITEHLSPVSYFLVTENDLICCNQLLGKKLRFTYAGSQCLNCKNKILIYRQGYCKQCFFEIPQAGDWILKPELSTAHLNIENRDIEYEKKVQLQPHIVYLADSGTIKVGVTRKTQLPTRWIDQGATKALPIVETPNRYLAGITEVELKKVLSDKTNWRKMLTQHLPTGDLKSTKQEIIHLIPEEAQPHIVNNENEYTFEYPTIGQQPTQVKSLNILKQEEYTGELVGIKGQYMIFKDFTVFNIRSIEGYILDLYIN